MLKNIVFLQAFVLCLFTQGSSMDNSGIPGYHLQLSQFESNYVGSWLYLGVGFEHIKENQQSSGVRVLKQIPVQAFAKFGFRAHTSLQFALDFSAQLAIREQNKHKLITDLNYLYFFQTSYDAIPIYYLGVGGPIHAKSILKMLYSINIKDLCFSNFILGKRLDAKKFFQIKVHDFRRLDYKKDNFYLPSLDKLALNTVFEICVGF